MHETDQPVIAAAPGRLPEYSEHQCTQSMKIQVDDCFGRKIVVRDATADINHVTVSHARKMA